MTATKATQRREREAQIVKALREAKGHHDIQTEWAFCVWEGVSPGWCHECDVDTSDIVEHILTAHRG